MALGCNRRIGHGVFGSRIEDRTGGHDLMVPLGTIWVWDDDSIGVLGDGII